MKTKNFPRSVVVLSKREANKLMRDSANGERPLTGRRYLTGKFAKTVIGKSAPVEDYVFALYAVPKRDKFGPFVNIWGLSSCWPNWQERKASLKD